MTLGGMLKHLAFVEDWWFGVVLAGRPPAPPFDDVDWDADNDWDWHSAPVRRSRSCGRSSTGASRRPTW